MVQPKRRSSNGSVGEFRGSDWHRCIGRGVEGCVEGELLEENASPPPSKIILRPRKFLIKI